MAPAAGRKNASAAPWHAASTASCQICAVPVSSSTAPVICTAARTRSLVIMRAARGSLSAHTPPTSASSDQRQALGGEHQAEVGARAGQVEHGEGERHRRDAVAEHRDALREEHVAEVAPAQRAGALAEACGDEAGETHAPSLQGRGGGGGCARRRRPARLRHLGRAARRPERHDRRSAWRSRRSRRSRRAATSRPSRCSAASASSRTRRSSG